VKKDIPRGHAKFTVSGPDYAWDGCKHNSHDFGEMVVVVCMVLFLLLLSSVLGGVGGSADERALPERQSNTVTILGPDDIRPTSDSRYRPQPRGRYALFYIAPHNQGDGSIRTVKTAVIVPFGIVEVISNVQSLPDGLVGRGLAITPNIGLGNRAKGKAHVDHVSADLIVLYGDVTMEVGRLEGHDRLTAQVSTRADKIENLTAVYQNSPRGPPFGEMERLNHVRVIVVGAFTTYEGPSVEGSSKMELNLVERPMTSEYMNQPTRDIELNGSLDKERQRKRVGRERPTEEASRVSDLRRLDQSASDYYNSLVDRSNTTRIEEIISRLAQSHNRTELYLEPHPEEIRKYSDYLENKFEQNMRVRAAERRWRSRYRRPTRRPRRPGK